MLRISYDQGAIPLQTRRLFDPLKQEFGDGDVFAGVDAVARTPRRRDVKGA